MPPRPLHASGMRVRLRAQVFPPMGSRDARQLLIVRPEWPVQMTCGTLLRVARVFIINQSRGSWRSSTR